MEPGVPFALLGGVQVLTVVACGGLTALGWLRRSAAGAALALGALVLAVVETRTALRLGSWASDDLALLRGVAGALLAVGLYGGALGRRGHLRAPEGGTAGVVVPLAAAGGPSALAAGATAVAAVAALAARRDPRGLWLGAGLALWAAAAGAGASGDHGRGALLVLLLRAAGTLAVLTSLLLLAQLSLLSKVVSAILVGVVTMAVSAIAVVGNVVVASYDTQTRETVGAAAQARVSALQDLGVQVAGQARLAARVCTDAPVCGEFLRQVVVNGQSDFVARVRRTGAPVPLAGRPALSASELLGLRSLPAVQDVLMGAGASRRDVVPDNVRLSGSLPTVAVVAVVADRAGKRGDQAPDSATVYGVRIDTDYTRNDVDLGGFGLTLLAGEPLQVVASNLPVDQQQRLVALVRGRATTPPAGETVGSQGANPTVALRRVEDASGNTVALLAMTREPGPALRTERDALRLLLGTALLALLLVGVAAVVLGRRTVEPVRQLTAAARRVSAGDLTATAAVRARDEVGVLSRTFDEMTGSLAQLTGDLRETAVRLETVLASMTDGLLATDASGVVTSVNPAALGLLGLEEPDVLGERLEVVVDLRDASGSALLGGATTVLEEPAEVLRPDGSRVQVRASLTPLAEAPGVVLVLRDTTREREVERMKTEFLSNVSHELRTPLTPIRGYAEILTSRDLDPDKVKAFAATIRDESLKMNRVVDLLVDVASLEAGRVHVTPRAISARELLDARVQAWSKRAPQRVVRRRVAGRLPDLMVDPAWIGKVLDELVDNAVKHTPGGPITLTAVLSPDGQRVRVAVRDTGPGVDPEKEERLFTSFEQADGSATRRVGGLGLGLGFVARFARERGFPLSYAYDGKGAEFALDLPVA